MAWFKVDDGLHSSRKLLSIPKRHRFAAVGLWTVAGSWCAGELTDGHVPDFMLEVWGAPPSAPASLVESGLWVRESGGYLFCNWHEYQPSKQDVDAERSASRERMRELRARRKQKKPQDDAEVGEVFGGTVPNGSESVRNPDPTRPDPTPLEEAKASSSSGIAKAIRPDVEALLDLLDSELRTNDVKNLPVRNKANTDAMRLLVDKDGYDVEQVARIIRWCQADSFWRGNVMSATKLREQFETLRAHANRKREERLQSAPSKSEKAHDFINELMGGVVDGRGETEIGGGRDGVGSHLELRQ